MNSRENTEAGINQKYATHLTTSFFFLLFNNISNTVPLLLNI